MPTRSRLSPKNGTPPNYPLGRKNMRLARCPPPECGGRATDTGYLSSAGICQPAPSKIVPRLVDKGMYLASESTSYRVLRRSDEVHLRGRQVKPSRVKLPTTFTATVPIRCGPGISRGYLRWYVGAGIICLWWKRCSAEKLSVPKCMKQRVANWRRL